MSDVQSTSATGATTSLANENPVIQDRYQEAVEYTASDQL